jgi:hypothetical protein
MASFGWAGLLLVALVVAGLVGLVVLLLRQLRSRS